MFYCLTRKISDPSQAEW